LGFVSTVPSQTFANAMGMNPKPVS
jgi:hypothetical protein